MKRRSILKYSVLIVIGIAAAAVATYYWNKGMVEEPLVPLYASKDEVLEDIERLEEARGAEGLKWKDTFRLGVAYMHSGRLEDAVTALEEATELKPDFHKGFESLGMAHFRLGNMEEAVVSWERALRINPDAAHLKDMIKRAGRKGAFDKRAAALIEEVERGGAGWAKRLELAALYMAMRKLDKAERELKEALKEKDDSPELYDALAEVYAMRGDFDMAVVAVKKALSLAPSDEALAKRLSLMEKMNEGSSEGSNESHGGR